MKCPVCDKETRHTGMTETLVGYHSPPGHDHDDNCQKRLYACTCGHAWIESKQRGCPVCDWKGKTTCFCHGGEKVAEWTDPENYVTSEVAKLRRR